MERGQKLGLNLVTINDWIRQVATTDPNVTFVDTRAAAAAPDNPDKLIESPDHCVLLNFPLLALFNKSDTVLGIPLLYAYLFGAWSLLIALMALVIERRPRKKTPASPRSSSPVSPPTIQASFPWRLRSSATSLFRVSEHWLR